MATVGILATVGLPARADTQAKERMKLATATAGMPTKTGMPIKAGKLTKTGLPTAAKALVIQ